MLEPVYACCAGGNQLFLKTWKQQLHGMKATHQEPMGHVVLRHASTLAQSLDGGHTKSSMLQLFTALAKARLACMLGQ